ncbi:PadR family transcriptional regulator [Pararhizobium sp. IMCC21322]|uniref:PadR family transcriptional regulator n=1 Tax=Pararhizobium sp. IMCC21322 TaxID=3067903 RepID=UPI0027417CC2|nr:PadR family transcriptional regulator [Pararhizobium sp. IMCC21322]
MLASPLFERLVMNVRTLCLGILNFEDATGYEIRKMSIDGKYSHFVDASYGSIYPALNKLESEGMVSCREETQQGKPARKIYSINAAGREELIKSLQEPPSPDVFRSEFLMIAISAEMLPHEAVTRAIDTHKKQLQQELSMIEQIEANSVHPSFLWAARYGMHCMSQSLKFLEDTRAELEACAGTRRNPGSEPSNDKHDADTLPKSAHLTGAQ